jgi:hypothetical protein
MPTADIDFGSTVIQGNNSDTVQNPANNGGGESNQDDKTHLNGGNADDITSKDGDSNNTPPADNSDTANDNNADPPTGELAAGDSIEVDGNTYTVAENGDIVDAEGKVFKEAKDVAEWLKSVEVEETDGSDSSLDINSLQKELGVTVTDEAGKPIEFTNDVAGVKSYVDAVIELRSKELQDAAVNRLYSDNPLLKQFQDYVELNGTPRGFGEIPDRSGIKLDKDNENQLVAVIRMAAQEFGNKSLNDNYIKYLRDSGSLYDEAKSQLQALVEKDAATRKDIETKAQEKREQQQKEVADYWDRVNKVVEGRVIGGYKIPESFTKEVDGKKVVVTPNDFFAYLSNPKETESGERLTGYQYDLSKLSDDEYLTREILDAWLMFTGGTYKNLIDMAVKEEKVRQLRVKSKEQRSTKSVKVIKNPSRKSSIDDIIL